MSPGHRKPITRTRELLACSECRRRKLKCDHEDPCSSCSKRGDEAACTYERFARGPANERERRKRAEAKLEHLEGLVQQLAALQGGAHVEPSSTSEPFTQNAASTSAARQNGFGISNGLAYAGSTHWSAMLEDIDELRTTLGPVDDELMSTATPGLNDDINILFGGASSQLSYEQVLDAFLPSRKDADRLVATYFRSSSVAAPFVHAGAFRRRYQQFWTDPQNAPPLWTSLFFTICHIADSVITVGSLPIQTPFNLAAAHCLACGKYYKPQPYAVEALLLFTQSKLFVRHDVTSDYAMLMASVVRLATSSGYHRDPSSLPISPFEKEMRRRTWSLCLQMDLLISFALGTPCNVQYPTWDTHRPGNILDTEFDETTIELPRSRPDSELTSMVFYNAKHTIMRVFEKILRYSLSTEPASIDEADMLNIELDGAYHSLPSMLRPLPIKDALFDSPSLIVTRLCVLFLYGKCRCVLHRKHAARGNINSINICYDASTTVLGYYIDIFEDFQPGGQFESERWLNSTITWQDFLLAIMVLCLVLFVTQQHQSEVVIDYAAALDLLIAARAACEQVSPLSKSTQRVERLIDSTIARFGGVETLHPLTNGGQHNADNVAISNGAWVPDFFGQEFAETWTQPDLQMPMTVEDDSWAYLEQFLNA